MDDDRFIDLVRATRDAYRDGLAEGERRASDRLTAAETRVAELEARLRRQTRRAS